MLFDNEAEHLTNEYEDIINHFINVLLTGTDNDISALLKEKRDELSYIYNYIKSNQKIQVTACACALSSMALIDDEDVSRNMISLLSSISYISTRKSLLNNFEHVIVEAFNASRILITKHKYKSLLKTIDINSLESTEQVGYFEQLYKKCVENNVEGQHLIYRIHHLLSLYNKEDPEPRTRTNNAIEKDESKEVIVRKRNSIVLDDDEFKVKSFQSAREINAESVDKEEYKIDSCTAKIYQEIDFSKTPYVHSLHLQQKQARNVAQHMYKREKQLACDYRLLSQFEIRKVTAFYLEHTSFSTWLTMLILCTGRTIEELQQLFRASLHETAHDFISYQLNLPEHKIESRLQKLVYRGSLNIFLLFNDEMMFEEFSSKIASEDTLQLENIVKTTISHIRQSVNNRITIPLLRNAFSAYLKREQVDSAEAAYLLNKEIRQTASCYYHLAKLNKINKIYQEWLSYLFAVQAPSYSNIDNSDKIYVGSRLVVNRPSIQALFSSIATELTYPVKKAKCIQEMHNTYVIFLILMLNLATGHRAVRHPYCYLNDFDLLTSRLFISDKENRSSLSARIIPLPPIIGVYINEYKQHLLDLLQLEMPYSHKTGSQIKTALASKVPFLFFLNEHNFEAVTPKMLEEKLKTIFPLPLNWNRHFVRGYLSNNNVNSQTIDAWMGHLSNSSEPFSKYSGLGSSDLLPIADTLQKLLSVELGLNENGLWANDVN